MESLQLRSERIKDGESASPLNVNSITAADLQSNSSLAELFRQACQRGLVTADRHHVNEFFALAERALQRDKRGTPGAMFHYMLKNKLYKYITNACEDRARNRLSFEVAEAIAESARNYVPATAAESQSIQPSSDATNGYLHSSIVQCGLPQKPISSREWRSQHGKAVLLVRAGVVAHPTKTGEVLECDVPSGSRGRLIQVFIQTEAIKKKSRVVVFGNNFKEFTRRLGLTWGGSLRGPLVRQVQNSVACEILLMDWNECGSRTRFARLADEYIAWIASDGNPVGWQSEIELTQRFYDALRRRPVLLDLEALLRLSNSPRRMDLCAWLPYRLYKSNPRQAVAIPLVDMHNIFFADIARHNNRLVRSRLKTDLEAIQSHLSFRFEWSIEKKYLVLRNATRA